MRDDFNREITYARISLTDLCNYRCVYCMESGGVQKKSHEEILRIEDFEKIIRALSELGIQKIRFTGGEPLVRKGGVYLIEETAKMPAFKTVGITTNGATLKYYAGRLARAGVDNINISIDSLKAERYNKITRGGNLQDALDGLRAIKDANVKHIKINAVLMRGINDDEIFEFAKFGKEEGVQVRFIELMPFERLADFTKKYFLSLDEVLLKYSGMRAIGSKGDCKTVFYQMPDGTEIGFISAISRKFCNKCDRIRITADGKLLNCLHENKEYNLKPYLYDVDALKNYIKECVKMKPKEHHITSGTIQHRDMGKIGG